MSQSVIKVTESERSEISAHKAVLRINVFGEKLFLGNAAMEKAKEVGRLVDKMSEGGIEPSKMRIVSAQVIGESGLLGKNTKVLYRMRVDADGDQIAYVVGCLSEGKGAQLEQIEWKYDEFDESCRLAQLAAKKCLKKAECMAKALDHELGEVVSLTDSIDEVENVIHHGLDDLGHGEGMRMARRKSMGPADFKAEMKGSKELHISVTAVFALKNPPA